MCALVTGVQTCALPICRAQALLVQAEGGAQAGATGADDEHFVLVFGDLVGVGHRGSRVARSGRAVRELLVCGTGRLVTAGRSWRSNTGTPARRSRTRTSPPVARRPPARGYARSPRSPPACPAWRARTEPARRPPAGSR